MRIALLLCVALLPVGCSGDTEQPDQVVPLPREIIDLGTLITETTPEEFWGKRFLNEHGFTESNEFDVINWSIGPVSGRNSYFRLFNHGGPHIDAPNHVGLGQGLDSYDVASFAGPLKVLDFSDLKNGRCITLDMVASLPISAGDVVLIYTGYSAPTSDDALPETVALTYEAAQHLAAIPVRAVGTDGFNFESMTDQNPVDAENELARTIPGHYAFLSKGIPIFEQLVNVESLLGKSNMYFVGAPLNIANGDGMLVRPLVLVY